MTLNTVHHESDLLVIGGGIAGLMTAIRAAELGLKVIVADKSNVRYSGAGATVTSSATSRNIMAMTSMPGLRNFRPASRLPSATSNSSEPGCPAPLKSSNCGTPGAFP